MHQSISFVNVKEAVETCHLKGKLKTLNILRLSVQFLRFIGVLRTLPWIIMPWAGKKGISQKADNFSHSLVTKKDILKCWAPPERKTSTGRIASIYFYRPKDFQEPHTNSRFLSFCLLFASLTLIFSFLLLHHIPPFYNCAWGWHPVSASTPCWKMQTEQLPLGEDEK